VLTMTNIRSVMGSMDLTRCCRIDEDQRAAVRVVDAAVSPWDEGHRIEIKDIVRRPIWLRRWDAMKPSVKRADILQAEGQRQSEILRAKAQAGKIRKARPARKPRFRDAEARERSRRPSQGDADGL